MVLYCTMSVAVKVCAAVCDPCVPVAVTVKLVVTGLLGVEVPLPGLADPVDVEPPFPHPPTPASIVQASPNRSKAPLYLRLRKAAERTIKPSAHAAALTNDFFCCERLVETVRVAIVGAPLTGVEGLEQAYPAGRPEQVNVTVPVNGPFGAIVML